MFRLESLRSRVSRNAAGSVVFPGLLAVLGVVGYLFAVRLPSLGSNVRLYTAFGDFVNHQGHLPLPGSVTGSDSFVSSYADFPALSMRIYQMLSLAGPTPNRFIWAAYLLLPLTVVMVGLAVKGKRLGLSVAAARTFALVGMLMGIWTARFYEDKTHFLWLPILVFLFASARPLLGAITAGVFAGWTGLVPLTPLLVSIRRSRQRMRLFVTAVLAMILVAFSAASMSFTLLANRAARESGETFWFGFWRYLPAIDNTSARITLALLASALAAFAFQRKWLSFPAAFSSSAFFIVTASSSFQHTRIWMLLPLAVFLLPSTRWQVSYLIGLLAWSCVPLTDFLGYGYFFSGSGLSAIQDLGLAIFTNTPVFIFYGAFVFAVWRGKRHAFNSAESIFEPNAQSAKQLSDVFVPVFEPPRLPIG